MPPDSTLWTHHNPVRISAGPGVLKQLHKLVPQHGKLLLVTTAGFTKRGITSGIMEQLGNERIVLYDQVTPNPELDALDCATEQLRNESVASIVALGGGSVMDTAKVFGVALPSGLARPMDDVLRQGNKQTWLSRIPVVAIPTTSGTGAEVTPFATIWDQLAHKKYSIIGENIYPTHALLDPELTLILPRQETLYSGLDAISHALESLWNRNRTPVSEAYALQSVTLANEALPIVLEQPNNFEQRSKMQHASLLAGLAISQTQTAIAHSISYPLTSHYGVPHGLACSFCLPALYELLKSTECLNSHINLVVVKSIELLKLFDLKKHISANLTINEITCLTSLMTDPDRANNFIISLDEETLQNVLNQSFPHV